MAYYPIFLQVERKPVLLVGGGHVALEKIGKLVDAGADVTVVAPERIPAVQAFVDDGRARLRDRAFQDGDTEGFELVMVATDDGAVNRRVADEARGRGILVNAADDVANCDFILPSLVRRGEIAIAASTGGSSPAMARWLRERLDAFLSDEVVALGDLLAEVRREVRTRDRACAAECTRTRTPPPLLCDACPNRIHPDAWQAAIDGELLSLLAQGAREQAQALLRERLGIAAPLQPAPWWRESEVRS